LWEGERGEELGLSKKGEGLDQGRGRPSR